MSDETPETPETVDPRARLPVRRRKRVRGRMARAFLGVPGLMPREIDFLKAFIRHYQQTGRWNATLAAIAIGLSPKGASVEGHRILHLPHVTLAWEAWMQKADRAADIDPTDAAIRHRQHLEAIAHSNILDGSALVADAEGNLRFLIRPSDQWSTQFARAVKRIKQKETIRTIDAERNLTETTIELEFEMHDKNAALRLEAQERGLVAKAGKLLLPDGTEVEGEGGIHIYQVNRFELPDNGRGPKPVAMASGAPS